MLQLCDRNEIAFLLGCLESPDPQECAEQVLTVLAYLRSDPETHCHPGCCIRAPTTVSEQPLNIPATR